MKNKTVLLDAPCYAGSIFLSQYLYSNALLSLQHNSPNDIIMMEILMGNRLDNIKKKRNIDFLSKTRYNILEITVYAHLCNLTKTKGE